MEFWEHFYNVYSNKIVEAFKKNNNKNFTPNCLNQLSIDYLYKNKINNVSNISNISNNNININESNRVFFPKISSDHSLNFIDDKKIINDNRILDWNENINNSGDIYYPKFGIFGNPSYNNLTNSDPYYNFKNLGSKSLSNGINHIPSFQNINNYSNYNNNISNSNFTPHKNSLLGLCMNNSLNSMTNLNQINNMNMNININTIKNSNQNLLNNSNNNLPLLNKESFVKGTLLSPPRKLFPLTKASIIPSMTDKNNSNFNMINPTNDNIEVGSSNINMFNKKRKRDIKNNKYVFFLGDNKKEKKEKEKEKDQSMNNTINITENTETINHTITINDSNDICSDKSKKPRGSKFRGVSRNGNQWQVLIMVNKKKRYVGSYSKEEEAARAYDKVALQCHGSKAKTNFDYTKQEVEDILASPQLLKLF